MRMDRHAYAAISAVEAMGETLGQLGRLARWPDLTLEQRAIGMTALVMGAPDVTVAQVAVVLGVTPDAIAGFFRDTGGPFQLLPPAGSTGKVEPADCCVFPSEALAYGEGGRP